MKGRFYRINGNLGNQLFQFAHIYTDVNSWGDKKYYLWFGNGKTPELEFSAFEFPPMFDYSNNFVGHSESEMYFDTELIKRTLFPAAEKKADYFKEKYGNLNNTLFVSVRRGDFITYKWKFLCCKAEWYNKAYKLLTKKNKYDKVIVTSDDIQWCKDNLDLGDNVIYIEDENPLDIIYLAYCCKDFIISTSTFSWWCAWFGEHNGGRIIRPEKKFVDNKFWFENKIFFPDRWEILNSEGMIE